MVRFQWHVEDGLGASVGPGQLVYLRDHGVLQAMVEIEMPGGSGSLEACMNIPQNYNTDSGVKELGIVIAHGCDASDWRGRLLAELAVSLARSGFLVMRYICHSNASEARRVAVFEKAADVAATSPYARGVTRWVLAGLGEGARVAALAASRVRSAVVGCVFMSYPLKEEMPDMSGEDAGGVQAAVDSSGPLLALEAPLLFVSASTDPLINEPALVELGPRLGTSDVRSVVLQDVDLHFRTLTGKGPHAATIRAVNAAFHEFVNATNAYRMDFCKLPRIWRGGAASGAPSAAAAENGSSKSADRPQLQRPACFRPIPSGPPQHVQQQQPQSLAMQASLPYGLSATAAQALAAQIQQRQAGTVGASATGGSAAQLLAQQMLLQQAAQAAQRRISEQADVGPASAAAAAAAKLAAAAAARGGGAAAGAPNQLASLAQVLSDPAAAAQIAAMLLRNSASQQQQQQILQLGVQQAVAAGDGGAGSGQAGRAAAGAANALLQAMAPTILQGAAAGGGAGPGGAGASGQALTMEALASALVQRLSQQQQPQQHVAGHSAAAPPLVTLQSGSAGQLLAATLLNQQQQLQGAGTGAAALQQQQLQQLLLQHQRQQQQQQQRQQLTLQLQEQLLQRQQEQQAQQRPQQGLQPALLLQSHAGSLPVLQALRPAGLAGGAGRGAAMTSPGHMLMLHTTGSGGMLVGAGLQSGLGQDGEDMDMADARPS